MLLDYPSKHCPRMIWKPSFRNLNFLRQLKQVHLESGLNLYQNQKTEAALLVKKQKTYTILVAAHDEADDDVIRTTASTNKKGFRKMIGSEDDDEGIARV